MLSYSEMPGIPSLLE